MYTSRCKDDRFAGPATRALFAVSACVLAAACGDDDPIPRLGTPLGSVEFQLFNANVGVHPNNDVLADPNNIFAESGIDVELRFPILNNADAPAAFYAWATLLATQPNGEHQYYTSLLLESIAATKEGEERFELEQVAVRGYQAVLDFFPRAIVFFDEELTGSFRVLPLAYVAILRLGGEPEGDWVEIINEDGVIVDVVEGAAPIRPDPDPDDDEDEDERKDEGS